MEEGVWIVIAVECSVSCVCDYSATSCRGRMSVAELSRAEAVQLIFGDASPTIASELPLAEKRDPR